MRERHWEVDTSRCKTIFFSSYFHRQFRFIFVKFRVRVYSYATYIEENSTIFLWFTRPSDDVAKERERSTYRQNQFFQFRATPQSRDRQWEKVFSHSLPLLRSPKMRKARARSHASTSINSFVRSFHLSATQGCSTRMLALKFSSVNFLKFHFSDLLKKSCGKFTCEKKQANSLI